MPAFWKLRAKLHDWVGKIIFIAICAAILAGLWFAREPLLALWQSIDSEMGTKN